VGAPPFGLIWPKGGTHIAVTVPPGGFAPNLVGATICFSADGCSASL
jgi:hypothetical protein